MADVGVCIRSWIKGTDDEVRSGLLGYLSLTYGLLILDSVTVRRTAEGRITLSFPCRTDRRGRKHAIIRPVDDPARRQFEAEILGELHGREVVE